MTTRFNDRRTVLKAIGSAGAIGLAGCLGGGGSESTLTEQTGDGDSTPGGDGDTTPSNDQTTYTTELADAHYPTAIATISTQVGQERGIFADHNLEIEDVTSFSGGGTTIRGIVTGGLGAGKTALPALVQAFLQGAPIYLCGITQATTDISFHALSDSGIKSIQDLSGMTVAVSNPGASSEAVTINSIVNADGITLDEVEIMHAGGLGEAVTAAEEGVADVTWALPPVSTNLTASDQWNLIWLGRDLAPNITQNVLAMGDRVIDEQPELASVIGHAYVDAHDYIKNNIEDAARVWGENNDLEEDLAIKALSYAGDPEQSQLYPPQCYNIELDEDILTTTAETMIEQGLIDEQPPWEDIVRQEVLPEDKRVDWI